MIECYFRIKFWNPKFGLFYAYSHSVIWLLLSKIHIGYSVSISLQTIRTRNVRDFWNKKKVQFFMLLKFQKKKFNYRSYLCDANYMHSDFRYYLKYLKLFYFTTDCLKMYLRRTCVNTVHRTMYSVHSFLLHSI